MVTFGYIQTHHLVDTVTLLRSEDTESFGDHTGVVLEECIRVLLQVLDTLPTLFEIMPSPIRPLRCHPQ
jgi:hypothetical protein